MKKSVLFTLIILLISLTGCKSLFTREGNLLTDAKNAEARGNYQAAVLNAAESVRIDNEYAEAIDFLKKIYPAANSYYRQKIEEKKSSGGQFSNDQIADYYSYLFSINESVKTLPVLYDPKSKGRISFEYTDYRADVDKYRSLAAEDHYQEGLRFMKLRGRENAKNAAREFEAALSLVPGYKDAERKAAEALELGTQVIAFFPFVNNAWNIPTSKFTELLQNSAVSTLVSDREVMKFTKIIDRDMQSRLLEEQIGSLKAMMDDKSRVEIGRLLNANIFITGSIDSAVLNGPSTSVNKQTRTTTIETADKASVKDDTKDQPTYKSGEAPASPAPRTVSADVFYYTKEISFEVTVSYKAVDVESGAILLSNMFKVSEDDLSEWMEWSGDERALSTEDWSMKSSSESGLKSSEQLASEAAAEVGKKIALELAGILK